MLRLVRLIYGFELLDYRVYMNQIKAFFHRKIDVLIESNEELAEDQLNDHTNINKILAFSQALRIIQLTSYLLCVSFLTGTLWYIYSDITEANTESNFIDDFSFSDKTDSEKLIALTYFTFTTLSTVGLGDYHPRSDSERLLGAFILMFGVAITSYIMENLNDMLIKFK